MRGEVLHYDETQGFGFITGADGNRYTFTRENLRRQAPMARGTVIEFQPSGGQARDVFPIRAPLSPSHAGPAQAAPEPFATQPPLAGPSLPPRPGAAKPSVPTIQHFGRNAEAETGASTGLWSYFWQGLTANYFNFAGRARRKEYWGYFLFWVASLTLTAAVGLFADSASDRLAYDEPFYTLGLSIAFLLATFLPGLGMSVRRLHDIGLSGWLYLLVLVPTIGSLIILVFALIPTQARENQWGPVPTGVRV